MPLPAIPATHRWVHGGLVAQAAGRTLLTASAGAAMWCWDNDTGTRVSDLYDQNGISVNEVPVVDAVFFCAVPKTITAPVFSVGEGGIRLPGNDWEAVRNALAATAPTDTQVSTLLEDTGSASRGSLDTILTDRFDTELAGFTAIGSDVNTSAANLADYLPSGNRVTVRSNSNYDAFPYTAYGNGTLLAVWRTDTAHISTSAAAAEGAISFDQGKTWGAPFILVADPDPDTTIVCSGLTYIPARNGQPGEFVMIAGRHNWTFGTDDISTMRSATGAAGTWASEQPMIWPDARWVVPTCLTWRDDGTTHGVLYASSYLSYDPTEFQTPGVMRSRDRGATWDLLTTPSEYPPTNHRLESMIGVFPDGELLVLMRTDDPVWSIYATRSHDDGKTWTALQAVITEASGQPAFVITPEGSVVALVRDYTPTGGVGPGTGRWAYATSTDRGRTFTKRTNFAQSNNGMVYGSLAPLPGGDLACVFATEATASPSVDAEVFSMRFRLGSRAKYDRKTRGTNKTLNVAGWQDVDTTLDIVLPAQPGDVIEYGPSLLLDGAGNTCRFDVQCVASGNTFAGGLADGVAGWYSPELALQKVTGSVHRTLVAADCPAGTVTLRLRVNPSNTTARIIFGAAVSWSVWARNHGPQTA